METPSEKCSAIRPGGMPNGDSNTRNGHDNPSVRKFTWRELSKLNKPHNAHVAYRGKVYDVSSFVSKHPGGVDQIVCAAGRDITLIFEAYHSLEVAKVLDKYYVGELVDNEWPVFPEMGQFYRTVRERVNKHLKDNNLDRKLEFGALFKNFCITVITLSTWYFSVVTYSFMPLALLLAVICGFFTHLFFLTMHHDSCHCAITHKPWVWKAIQLFSESVLGMSSYCWKHQHIFGHHPYTNMEHDPDIATVDEPPSFWRIKSSQRRVKVYSFQHLYMPVAYALIGTKFKIEDFIYVYKGKRSQIRMNPLTTSQLMMFWTGKIVHVLFRYVVPYLYVVLPIWKLIVINAVCDLVASIFLGNVNMSNHLSTGVILPPKPDENNEINIDWAELQVISTLDWCTDSVFSYLISGGNNHQTAHHLFPDMVPSHYFWVTPIIRETCKEFGVQYNCMTSFGEAWKKHVEFLKNMGNDLGSKKSG